VNNKGNMNKEFKTQDDIINDPHFKESIIKILHELRSTRHNRPSPPKGRYYKRDWYDRIIDAGRMDHYYFIKHIKDIWNKTSTINSETRGVIQYVCDKALRETFIEYSKQEQQEEKEKGLSIPSNK